MEVSVSWRRVCGDVYSTVMYTLFLVIIPSIVQLNAQEIPYQADREFGFARHLYMQGEFSLAAEEFKRLIDSYPGNPQVEEIAFLRADCYVQLRRWDRALDELNAFIRRYPTSTYTSTARQRRAVAAFERGDMAGAKDYYLDLAGRDPSYAGEALYWAGEAAYKLGDPAEAVEILERSSDRSNGEVRAWALRRRGHILKELGDRSRASVSFEHLMALPEATPDDYLELSELMIALDRPDDAYGYIERLRERWPDWMGSSEALAIEARALWTSGRRDEAMGLLKAKPSEQPHLLGWMLLESGDAEDAARVLLDALDSMSGPQRDEASVLAARALYETGDVHRADSLLALEIAGMRVPQTMVTAVLLRGRLLMQREKPAEAYDLLHRGMDLMKDGRDSSAAYALMGEAKGAQDQWDHAYDYFRRALDTAPESRRTTVHYLTGVAAFRAELLPEAERFLIPVVEAPGDSLAAWAAYWIGETTARNDRWDDAAAWYRLGIEKAADAEIRSRAWFGLGWALLSLGEHIQAGEAFERTYEESPDSDLSSRALVRKGDVELIRGAYDAAILSYRSATERIGDASLADEAMLKLGRALALSGKVDSALDTLEELYQASPAGDFADDALLSRGEILFGEKRYDEATSAFQRLIQLHRDRDVRDNALYRIGDCHYNQGAYANALDTYLQVVRSYPESDLWGQAVQGVLWSALQVQDGERAIAIADSIGERVSGAALKQITLAKAELLFGLKRYEEALQLFQSIDDDPVSTLRAAWCYERLGDVQNAGDVFRSVARRWPNDPGAPEALYQASQMTRREGRYRDSVDLLNSILRDYPGSDIAATARYDLGLSWLEAGRSDKAHGIWSDLVRGTDGEWARRARIRLGEIALNEAQPDSALAWITPVLSHEDPTVGVDAHWIAAEAELARGNPDKARRLFIRLTYLFPESEKAVDARRRAEEIARDGGSTTP